MLRVRKLQFIGGQFLLNFPKTLVEKLRWEKGDYFNIQEKDKDTLEIKRVGNKDMTKIEVVLPKIEREIMDSFGRLYHYGENMNPEEFVIYSNKLSHLLSRSRRHKIRIKNKM